jgi:hypothetical protein
MRAGKRGLRSDELVGRGLRLALPGKEEQEHGAEAEQEPGGSERRGDARGNRSEPSLPKRALDLTLPDVPEGDRRCSDKPKAGADNFEGPRRRVGERREELAGSEADGERRQARPPPRKIGPLVREPCALVASRASSNGASITAYPPSSFRRLRPSSARPPRAATSTNIIRPGG